MAAGWRSASRRQRDSRRTDSAPAYSSQSDADRMAASRTGRAGKENRRPSWKNRSPPQGAPPHQTAPGVLITRACDRRAGPGPSPPAGPPAVPGRRSCRSSGQVLLQRSGQGGKAPEQELPAGQLPGAGRVQQGQTGGHRDESRQTHWFSWIRPAAPLTAPASRWEATKPTGRGGTSTTPCNTP